MRNVLLVGLFLGVVFAGCKSFEIGKEKGGEDPRVIQTRPDAPNYVVTIMDEDMNILNTRYVKKELFDAESDDAFAQHELSKVDENKVDVQVLQGDDGELESSTESFYWYWEKTTFYWKKGNETVWYEKEKKYYVPTSPYRRPVYIYTYRRNDYVW